MINFRVRDLNKMVAQLRERGITIQRNIYRVPVP